MKTMEKTVAYTFLQRRGSGSGGRLRRMGYWIGCASFGGRDDLEHLGICLLGKRRGRGSAVRLR